MSEPTSLFVPIVVSSSPQRQPSTISTTASTTLISGRTKCLEDVQQQLSDTTPLRTNSRRLASSSMAAFLCPSQPDHNSNMMMTNSTLSTSPSPSTSPFKSPTTSIYSLSLSSDSNNINGAAVYDGANTHYSPVHSPKGETDPISTLFQHLQSPDIDIRLSALESITSALKEPDNERLLRLHLNTIIVLATESPFEEITQTFTTFLHLIQDKYHIPKQRTTSFIKESKLTPLNTSDETTKQLFQEVFMQSGRVNRVVRLLGWHPQYLDKFLSSYNKVMRDPGPLPLFWRNYIAILTASRYNCTYLVSLQEHEFIQNKGDPKWLAGIDHIPNKLRNLMGMIQTMAHQPWHMVSFDIGYLVKGTDSWSIAELIHAMIVISTFLSLSGFVSSCGILPEYGLITEEKQCFSLDESGEFEMNDPSSMTNTIKIMELLGKMRVRSSVDDQEAEETGDRHTEFLNAGLFEPSPLFDNINNASNTSDGSSNSSQSGGSTTNNGIPTQQTSSQFSKYTGDFTMTHSDFDIQSRQYQVFSVQDYSWKEHGYELVSRIFPEVASLLDEEFNLVYSLTYNQFNNNTDIDTLPFRRAIWYYVQRVKGICHDDYNYREVNMLLNRDLKHYVKKAVCFPDSITKEDYSMLGFELQPAEKCHLSLLAVCSHKQAVLLYGLYSIMSYQNSR
ncbi:hypothetical protein SAMD00019534_118500 [Acytostelium subglobosum LB1]|uniref:hypothetical protein n=1 Tax=Acytostelium subglobosum LB1 TaxID=1410327 RepID=UPI000644D9AA|nr:hypothetical protein SAMD00019534_118500 [Acytostelium subglobosum LB1]GAM28674.1 hypothetical protein SAMD00019534_118500 [Acytostelium subglobosum LB1]|eukprot:XP_012748452.1 hypothetical protein SAMD00019534_118500 [Acytostelium subglobosum LB1]